MSLHSVLILLYPHSVSYHCYDSMNIWTWKFVHPIKFCLFSHFFLQNVYSYYASCFITGQTQISFWSPSFHSFFFPNIIFFIFHPYEKILLYVFYFIPPPSWGQRPPNNMSLVFAYATDFRIPFSDVLLNMHKEPACCWVFDIYYCINEFSNKHIFLVRLVDPWRGEFLFFFSRKDTFQYDDESFFRRLPIRQPNGDSIPHSETYWSVL